MVLGLAARSPRIAQEVGQQIRRISVPHTQAAMQAAGVLRIVAGRAISTSALASQALPAVATDPVASGGSWITRLLGGPAREGTPLTDALPGVPEVKPAQWPDKPPDTEMTTYPNGAKVASENTPVRSRGWNWERQAHL